MAISPKLMKFELSPVLTGKENHTCVIPPSRNSLTRRRLRWTRPWLAKDRASTWLCLAKKDWPQTWVEEARPCDAAGANRQGDAARPAAAGPDVIPRAAPRRSLSSASSLPASSARPAAPGSSLCAGADVGRCLGHGAGCCWQGRG